MRVADRSGVRTSHDLPKSQRLTLPAGEESKTNGRREGDNCRTDQEKRLAPRYQGSTQSFAPYTISSTDWLDLGSPDSTKPAKCIQAPPVSCGSVSRTARRITSAMEMPRACDCSLTRLYSPASRLTCVRIMLSIFQLMITLFRRQSAHAMAFRGARQAGTRAG